MMATRNERNCPADFQTRKSAEDSSEFFVVIGFEQEGDVFLPVEVTYLEDIDFAVQILRDDEAALAGAALYALTCLHSEDADLWTISFRDKVGTIPDVWRWATLAMIDAISGS